MRAERLHTWMLYSLPKQRSRVLWAQLQCLKECARGQAVFEADEGAFKEMAKRTGWVGEAFRRRD